MKFDREIKTESAPGTLVSNSLFGLPVFESNDAFKDINLTIEFETLVLQPIERSVV